MFGVFLVVLFSVQWSVGGWVWPLSWMLPCCIKGPGVNTVPCQLMSHIIFGSHLVFHCGAVPERTHSHAYLCTVMCSLSKCHACRIACYYVSVQGHVCVIIMEPGLVQSNCPPCNHIPFVASRQGPQSGVHQALGGAVGLWTWKLGKEVRRLVKVLGCRHESEVVWF